MSKHAISGAALDAIKNLDSTPDSGYARDHVVAAWYCCSRATIWRWAKEGVIPSPKKLGPRVTAWNVGEIRAAL
ncbi:AlpA family phage regulatory protein, partial [bacterium]|nr:AlpA family phage regulatory protein [bacterium]